MSLANVFVPSSLARLISLSLCNDSTFRGQNRGPRLAEIGANQAAAGTVAVGLGERSILAEFD